MPHFLCGDNGAEPFYRTKNFSICVRGVYIFMNLKQYHYINKLNKLGYTKNEICEVMGIENEEYKELMAELNEICKETKVARKLKLNGKVINISKHAVERAMERFKVLREIEAVNIIYRILSMTKNKGIYRQWEDKVAVCYGHCVRTVYCAKGGRLQKI